MWASRIRLERVRDAVQHAARFAIQNASAPGLMGRVHVYGGRGIFAARIRNERVYNYCGGDASRDGRYDRNEICGI